MNGERETKREYPFALPSGTLLAGRYRILSVLGQGTFGITYRAFDQSVLERDVAIKEYFPSIWVRRGDDNLVQPLSPRDEMLYRQFRDRFEKEAKILASLKAGAGIIHLHDIVYAHGTLAAVMDYVRGQTLEQMLKVRKKLSEHDALGLLVPILSGLERVHARSIVHRDIKPANIMIDEAGEPVLIDFGAARVVLPDGPRRFTEVLTPAYAAPEQLQDAPHGPWTDVPPSARTDIYALAVTVREAVEGRLPPSAMTRIGSQDRNFVPLSKLAGAGVSPAFAHAIDKAMTLDPGGRPQDIKEWRRAFGEALTHPQRAPDERKIHRGTTARWVVSFATGAAVLAVLAAGAPFVPRLFDRAQEEMAAAKRAKADEAAAAKDQLEKAVAAFNRKEYRAALELWQPLAVQGNAKAQSGLGALYEKGFGVPVDFDEAVRWYRKAADQHDAAAQAGLGYMYEYGRGVAKDDVEAAKWYRRSADQDHARGQHNLGVAYLSGLGVAKDDVEALKWFRKSADQGYISSQHNVGYMYEYGRGVVKDDVEAVKWYRKAADQGNAGSQTSLGSMYRDGRGVLKDDVEAVKWFRRAADLDSATAQANLGYMYELGRGVVKDDVEAAKWYRKAADQGNAHGQSNLGSMYRHGRGVSKDDVEAVKWYRKAADQGLADGQTKLGSMYLDGLGVVKNEVEAVKWFRMAADQGNAWGQANLGLVYRYGRGVSVDLVQAYMWLDLASKQGLKDSQSSRDSVASMMTPSQVTDAQRRVREWTVAK